MGAGRAVQSHPGHDAVFLIEKGGGFGKVAARRADRDHAGAPICIFPPHNLHGNAPLPQRPKPVKELSGEGPLVLCHRFDARGFKPAKAGQESGNARQIQGSRLKPVRHEVRHLLQMAHASRAPCKKRLHLPAHPLAKDKAAGALGTQKALVPGEGKGIDVQLSHMDGQNARSLGRVHNKAQPVGPAEFPGLPQGKNRPADIAGVSHDQCPCIGLKAGRKRFKRQGAVRPAPCPGKFHSLPGKLGQRPHHRVVLHGGGNHVVPRL